MLLVTDGQFNVNKMLSLHNAYEVKHARVEIFVIVIGNFPRDIEEILNIASPPPQDHVLRIRSYGDFIDVVLLAIKKISPTQYKMLQSFPPSC